MPRFERDPQKLLQEMNARIKLRDIQHLHDLRDRLANKWYESLMLILLYPAALGLIFVLVNGVEKSGFFTGKNLAIARFIYIWAGLFIIGLCAMIEVILTRLRAMRRMSEALYDELVELHRDSAETRTRVEQLTELVGAEKTPPENSPTNHGES